MMSRFTILLLCGWSCQAATLQTEANPIRKVVGILQNMQGELQTEGEKEKGLYEKFMCYCDGNTDGMSKSAEDAGQAITELKSKLEAEKAEKSQLDQELIQHKQDRAGASADLETAESIRAKEHADYVASTGDQKTNVDAMTGAIAALKKGAGASFLQANTAALSKIVEASQTVDDFQKTQITEFIQGKNPNGDYSSQSGEIVGMLAAMKDEMDKDLGGAISAEEEAAKGFAELTAAKKAEIAAASEAVESKTARAGELAVSITTTADDIEDTTAEMNDTQAFLANLSSQCATKKKEWAARSATRADEIAAISEAIKILNDDDALDLFKKTMSLAETSTNMGFLQKKSTNSVALRARDILGSIKSSHKTQLALIELSLKSKAIDFSKVIAQIDNMSAIMVSEQKDDDSQKEFCDTDLAKSEKSKVDTETSIASSEAAIEEASAASAATADEMANLQREVKALDKAVADATAQRKAEHAEFTEFSSQSNAAVQLIEKAKNRLFKFYRPNLHKTAPKRELNDEEQLVVASGGVDPRVAEEAAAAATDHEGTVYVQVKLSDDAAPPPPPETWGAYEKKGEKSNGVIGLMEMLTKELNDDMTAAKHEEETSQSDYERLMADSQASRAQNVESITSKEAAKADLDMTVENTKQQKTSQETELTNVKGYIAQLHANCDFLIDNYDLRKAARENEAESLQNAKSVLSGANFA